MIFFRHNISAVILISFLELPLTAANISVSPPTLPKYISRIRIICENAESSGVMPSVSPTVPIAEAVS